MQQICVLHEQQELIQAIAVPVQETLDYFFVLFANTPIERKLVFTLADGAQVNVRGLVLASGGAEVKLTTDMIHEGKNTEGLTTVKGIMTDKAQANVTGWIRIPESGHNTNAFLEQRFLLLSKSARAKAEPMLEILANDVKASHAASVSRLNDDQLFYCESRGLGPPESKRLLTEAFVNEIVQKIQDHAIVEACQKQLQQLTTHNSPRPLLP